MQALQNKYQYKKIESGSSVFKVPETEVNQYVTQEVQDENRHQQCPTQTDTMLQKRKCHKVKSANIRSQKSRSCATKCKKEHKKDQIVMLPYKPATKVKKPGQETHKEVIQNKNCSNVNIVNMQPQKASLNHEQFKKSATMYKYKYKKHPKEVIHYDKQWQETKQSVCEGKKCPSTQCYDRKPVMKIKMCSQENQPQKQNQVYVETGTVSLQDASRKLQNVHIQRVQRNQDVEMTRTVNHPSSCGQRKTESKMS